MFNYFLMRKFLRKKITKRGRDKERKAEMKMGEVAY